MNITNSLLSSRYSPLIRFTWLYLSMLTDPQITVDALDWMRPCALEKSILK